MTYLQSLILSLDRQLVPILEDSNVPRDAYSELTTEVDGNHKEKKEQKQRDLE